MGPHAPNTALWLHANPTHLTLPYGSGSSATTAHSIPGTCHCYLPPCLPAVTKKLWLQRYHWTPELLEEKQPQTEPLPQPPRPTSVTYPFSTDAVLREHCKRAGAGSVVVGQAACRSNRLCLFSAAASVRHAPAPPTHLQLPPQLTSLPSSPPPPSLPPLPLAPYRPQPLAAGTDRANPGGFGQPGWLHRT